MLRRQLQNSARIALRSSRAPQTLKPATAGVLQTRMSSAHAEETFEQFTDRYVNFFGGVQDVFELQRGLNNAFAYDLVPATSVIEAALRAARRVNDFSTAVRIFEGIEEKVENKSQYQQYLQELKGIREELGIATKEELWGKSS
ncbi:Cytochrome c oxidase subunit 6 [Serendipita sp. 399]|nr:Cytochrome c oxidase subunit 6 [Serendipita sp. 399]